MIRLLIVLLPAVGALLAMALGKRALPNQRSSTLTHNAKLTGLAQLYAPGPS